MLAQGSQQYQCLKWVPDNSSLPSQLQFRQDFGVFPVMTVPGYFLFVLIWSCMLNEIMLFRLQNVCRSLSGTVLDDPQSFSLVCVQMKLCQFCMSAVVQTQLPHGAPKKLVCLPSATGALWENGDEETWWMKECCCLATVRGSPFPVYVVGSWRSTPRSGCAWPLACALAGTWSFTQGHLFSSETCFRHPLALHKLTLVGFFLMHQPDGCCSKVKTMDGFLQHEGFQENQALSLRFCLDIKSNGVCAWGNRLVGFKGTYLVTLSAKLFLCLYEEHVTSWKVAVFLIESGIAYK